MVILVAFGYLIGCVVVAVLCAVTDNSVAPSWAAYSMAFVAVLCKE